MREARCRKYMGIHVQSHSRFRSFVHWSTVCQPMEPVLPAKPLNVHSASGSQIRDHRRFAATRGNGRDVGFRLPALVAQFFFSLHHTMVRRSIVNFLAEPKR